MDPIFNGKIGPTKVAIKYNNTYCVPNKNGTVVCGASTTPVAYTLIKDSNLYPFSSISAQLKIDDTNCDTNATADSTITGNLQCTPNSAGDYFKMTRTSIDNNKVLIENKQGKLCGVQNKVITCNDYTNAGSAEFTLEKDFTVTPGPLAEGIYDVEYAQNMKLSYPVKQCEKGTINSSNNSACTTNEQRAWQLCKDNEGCAGMSSNLANTDFSLYKYPIKYKADGINSIVKKKDPIYTKFNNSRLFNNLHNQENGGKFANNIGEALNQCNSDTNCGGFTRNDGGDDNNGGPFIMPIIGPGVDKMDDQPGWTAYVKDQIIGKMDSLNYDNYDIQPSSVGVRQTIADNLLCSDDTNDPAVKKKLKEYGNIKTYGNGGVCVLPRMVAIDYCNNNDNCSGFFEITNVNKHYSTNTLIAPGTYLEQNDWDDWDKRHYVQLAKKGENGTVDLLSSYPDPNNPDFRFFKKRGVDLKTVGQLDFSNYVKFEATAGNTLIDRNPSETNKEKIGASVKVGGLGENGGLGMLMDRNNGGTLSDMLEYCNKNNCIGITGDPNTRIQIQKKDEAGRIYYIYEPKFYTIINYIGTGSLYPKYVSYVKKNFTNQLLKIYYINALDDQIGTNIPCPNGTTSRDGDGKSYCVLNKEEAIQACVGDNDCSMIGYYKVASQGELPLGYRCDEQTRPPWGPNEHTGGHSGEMFQLFGGNAQRNCAWKSFPKERVISVPNPNYDPNRPLIGPGGVNTPLMVSKDVLTIEAIFFPNEKGEAVANPCSIM